MEDEDSVEKSGINNKLYFMKSEDPDSREEEIEED